MIKKQKPKLTGEYLFNKIDDIIHPTNPNANVPGNLMQAFNPQRNINQLRHNHGTKRHVTQNKSEVLHRNLMDSENNGLPHWANSAFVSQTDYLSCVFGAIVETNENNNKNRKAFVDAVNCALAHPANTDRPNDIVVQVDIDASLLPDNFRLDRYSDIPNTTNTGYLHYFSKKQAENAGVPKGTIKEIETQQVRAIFHIDPTFTKYPTGMQCTSAFPLLTSPLAKETNRDLTTTLEKTPVFQDANNVQRLAWQFGITYDMPISAIHYDKQEHNKKEKTKITIETTDGNKLDFSKNQNPNLYLPHENDKQHYDLMNLSENDEKYLNENFPDEMMVWAKAKEFLAHYEEFDIELQAKRAAERNSRSQQISRKHVYTIEEIKNLPSTAPTTSADEGAPPL